jgi:hypothetical protein
VIRARTSCGLVRRVDTGGEICEMDRFTVRLRFNLWDEQTSCLRLAPSWTWRESGSRSKGVDPRLGVADQKHPGKPTRFLLIPECLYGQASLRCL